MTNRRGFATAAVLLVGSLAAGCGGSTSAPVTPSSHVQRVPGSASGNIVLSAQGAQRIGIQTASARGGGGAVAIPFSAIVYDSSGKTYAFTNPAPLTYSEVPVDVSRIDGNTAYLNSGPRAGARVVTVGAEELYGVQTGVLAQT
ncbi:MAG: hypothetical protein JOZ73_13910 [Solirubrobacterales bacterium]|nr:hypothetical protein [Solirubrobacterales bacterium]